MNMGIAWKLNDSQQAKIIGQNNETLTHKVSQIIELSDETIADRVMILTEAMMIQDQDGEWVDAYAIIRDMFGEPTRVLGIAYMDGRAIMLGDCPCRGADCRSAWGWVHNSRDLNMTGHRGSQISTPCPSMPKRTFVPTTGEFMTEAPYGMNPEEYYRYQREEWGDVDKKGLADFMSANLAIAENRKSKYWKVD
jgi:hypothetical protein